MNLFFRFTPSVVILGIFACVGNGSPSYKERSNEGMQLLLDTLVHKLHAMVFGADKYAKWPALRSLLEEDRRVQTFHDWDNVAMPADSKDVKTLVRVVARLSDYYVPPRKFLRGNVILEQQLVEEQAGENRETVWVLCWNLFVIVAHETKINKRTVRHYREAVHMLDQIGQELKKHFASVDKVAGKEVDLKGKDPWKHRGVKWSRSEWGPLAHYKAELKKLAQTELKNELTEAEIEQVRVMFSDDQQETVTKSQFEKMVAILETMGQKIDNIKAYMMRRNTSEYYQDAVGGNRSVKNENEPESANLVEENRHPNPTKTSVKPRNRKPVDPEEEERTRIIHERVTLQSPPFPRGAKETGENSESIIIEESTKKVNTNPAKRQFGGSPAARREPRFDDESDDELPILPSVPIEPVKVVHSSESLNAQPSADSNPTNDPHALEHAKLLEDDENNSPKYAVDFYKPKLGAKQ